MNGHSIEVSDCCDAPIQWGGVFGDYRKECSKCGANLDMINHSRTHFKYYPSKFEADLDKRVTRLETEVKGILIAMRLKGLV